MLINLRNALMAGKRTPTAKDYFGFLDSAFFYDGIENAGLGTHVDTLPVAYGKPQWINLAPMALNLSFNTDLDVVDMTPTNNSLSFSVGSAWAGWGYTFNTAKISVVDAQSLLNTVLNQVQHGNYYSAESTVEVVFGQAGMPSANRVVVLAGFNECSLFYAYTSTDSKRSMWYKETRNNWETQNTVLQQINQSNAPGKYYFAFSQSSTNNISKAWVDGKPAFTNSTYTPTSFFKNMVALKRANSVTSGMSAGEYFRLQITPKLLTDEEVAHNYAIDKARFNLPDAT